MQGIDSLTSLLRYPGSKSKVLKKILPYLEIKHKEYREPFVGGGSVFLSKNRAEINWINDKDTDISTLWKVIKNQPFELIRLIDSNYPTIDLWKEVKNKKESLTNVEKAFRCLFLNRTNFSGILNASPIGGMTQNSNYKIDCRWNAIKLMQNIVKISRYLEDVRVTSYNYSKLITEEGKDVLLFLDPPYYQKGKVLYQVYMTPRQHAYLASLLKDTKHKFLLTIDDCEDVRKLYSWANYKFSEQWKYTVYSSNEACKNGSELFITNFDIDISNFKERLKSS